MKTMLMMLLCGLLPLDSLGGEAALRVLGKITRQDWRDAMWGCREAGSTGKLLLLLELDTAKFGYTNCTLHETEYPAGYGLHRNCDQIEGYAAFASSAVYCQTLAKPFREKK
jgi:hypothetical protein